jgi:prepilin-type N-terminal cleavage/methylation domain-containing protein
VKGFTFVELLIVILILALVATLAFPMFADSDAARVQAAARLLTADLGFAQLDSITHTDDRCVVTFNQGAGSYTLARNSAPTTPITEPVTGQSYVTVLGTGRAKECSGVTIQSYSLGGDDKISFGPFGELDQSTAATIQLQRGSFSITVQIDPTTGEVTTTP